VCLGQCADDTSVLPVVLNDLLARSDSLYRRIARLDDILFGRGEAAPAGARGHLDTLSQAFAGK
jgi:regulator of CtrA degradation